MIRLDLADLQGNIHRPYGRFGFPHTRHLFFVIHEPLAGRRFVQGVRPRVTTAEPWLRTEAPDGKSVVEKPPITLNIGFTYQALRALDLPTETLRLLPEEFIDGMSCRADILGDVGGSAPERWDPAWRGAPYPAHVWVSLNVGANSDGTPLPILEAWTNWLIDLVDASAGGVTMRTGHGADGAGRWQDSSALMADGPDGTRIPIPKEHFQFTDGISDPVFRGQFAPDAEALASIGGGKIEEGPYVEDKSWSPLASGEFILGQVDEGQEFPVAAEPRAFMRNGTFMVWRKLHQDVEIFEAYVRDQATLWRKVYPSASQEEAEETIRAKIVGRWRSGIPLAAAPNWAEHQRLIEAYADCIEIALRKPRDSKEEQRLAEYVKLLSAFRYGDDPDGVKCPLGSHIRRANPRDMLDPQISPTQGASTLTNRRRILRRGLPYVDPNGERGVIFMAICASLFRQFEFVQQQWMNYGLDFDAGNDSCPLIGSRASSNKHVIPSDGGDIPPFIAAGLPDFVTTRGGDYFFLPGINAVRMIAMGTIDPT